jgi:hypothetical protein
MHLANETRSRSDPERRSSRKQVEAASVSRASPRCKLVPRGCLAGVSVDREILRLY